MFKAAMVFLLVFFSLFSSLCLFFLVFFFGGGVWFWPFPETVLRDERVWLLLVAVVCCRRRCCRLFLLKVWECP